MEQYGILAPVLGIQEAIPHILMDEANFPDMLNCRFNNHEVWRVRGRRGELKDDDENKVQTPDENPILRYHFYFKRATGSGYLLIFTKDHVYYWWPDGYEVATPEWETGEGYSKRAFVTHDGTTYWCLEAHTSGVFADDLAAGKWEEKAKSRYLEIFECSSSCESWSTADFADKCIATNNTDLVQVFDGDTSAGFEPLDSASGIDFGSSIYLTAAKYVTAFENYLILANTLEDGVRYRQKIRWSDIGQEDVWNSGDADFLETPGTDEIIAFAKRQGRLFILKENSILNMWLVPAELVFNATVYSPNYGCKSPKSIVETPEGHVFYFASDGTFKELQGDEVSVPVNKTIAQIPADRHEDIRGVYSWGNRVCLWAYTEGPEDDNNRVLSYDHLRNKWAKESKPVSAFGAYRAGAQAFDWITLPYENWLDWDWDSWMWVGGQEGVEALLSGDVDGYTYSYYGGERDDGVFHNAYFVLSTDLKKQETLSHYKRLLFMQMYFRREIADTQITIEIKADTEETWQTVGTVNLWGDKEILIKEIPVDVRGKTFLIRLSGSNAFKFLGVIFQYEYVGER